MSDQYLGTVFLLSHMRWQIEPRTFFASRSKVGHVDSSPVTKNVNAPMFSAVDVHRSVLRISRYFAKGINKLSLVFFKTFYGLPVPVINAAIHKKTENAIDGLLWNGVIHVVLDKMTFPEYFEKTLFQEFSHKGLSHFVGGGIEVSLNKLFISSFGWIGIKQIENRHNANLQSCINVFV
ncbi:hypothetical protein [Undibacterium sp. SXout20W]|uniref:hypothetical protein n=1 Tax=Undibacterium sp. SXout20W TaxID=3413051 RepID=UPI003BF21C7C